MRQRSTFFASGVLAVLGLCLTVGVMTGSAVADDGPQVTFTRGHDSSSQPTGNNNSVSGGVKIGTRPVSLSLHGGGSKSETTVTATTSTACAPASDATGWKDLEMSFGAPISSTEKIKLAGRCVSSNALTLLLETFDIIIDIPVPANLPDPPPAPWQYTLNGGLWRGSLANPLGLASEGASGKGRLQVRVLHPDEEDLVFSIESDPSGSTNLPSTITVPAGRTVAQEYFDAFYTGDFTVTVTLLDASGDPTSYDVDLAGTATSLDDVATPALWVILDGEGKGIPGASLGFLRVGRMGFADFDTEETTVDLQVNGAQGIISVPASVTIGPGESSVRLPLVLGQGVGSATIVVDPTGAAFEIVVTSEEQSWSSLASFRLPVGARAYLPIHLAVPQDGTILYSLGNSDPTRLTLFDEGEEGTIFAELGMKLLGLEATATGSTTLTLSSQAIDDDLTVQVEVVTADIEVSDDSILVDNTTGSDGGIIFIALPSGAQFVTATGPAGSDAYMSISGVGTNVLTLHFKEGVSRPSSIEISTVTADLPVEPTARIIDELHAVTALQYEIGFD